MSEERIFTVPEVNDMIPRLEVIISQMQRHGRALREAIAAFAESSGLSPDDITTQSLLESCPELRDEAVAIQGLLEEVEGLGGDFKGLDLGLVDFPGEVDGKRVLLCWQYGEKEVTHYHTVESGFAGRQPIDPRRADTRVLQ